MAPFPLPGFADPVDDAQAIFRLVLDAFAHPGRIVTIARPLDLPPGPLGRAAIGTALALFDFETPIWLDDAAGAAGPHLKFHCNCPSAQTRDRASFALIGDPSRLPALDSFALGSDAYPDRSTTLIIEVAALRRRVKITAAKAPRPRAGEGGTRDSGRVRVVPMARSKESWFRRLRAGPSSGSLALATFSRKSGRRAGRPDPIESIIFTRRLGEAGTLRLTGPGIEDSSRLGITGLKPGFWAERAALAPLFPRGLDLILTCGDRLAALPRTTIIEE